MQIVLDPLKFNNQQYFLSRDIFCILTILKCYLSRSSFKSSCLCYFKKKRLQLFSNPIIRLLSSKKHYWYWSPIVIILMAVWRMKYVVIFFTIIPSSAFPIVRQIACIPVFMLSLVKGSWLCVTPSLVRKVTYMCLHVLGLHLTFHGQTQRTSWYCFCQVICASRAYIFIYLERLWRSTVLLSYVDDDWNYS